MKSRNVLMLGCGDIGTALALRLQEKQWQVSAVRRDITQLPTGLKAHALDYTDPDSVHLLRDIDCDIAVMTPTPAGRDVVGYTQGFLTAAQQLLDAWETGPDRELIFVSSTRVYGDHGGDWVDEATAPRPLDAQAEIILAAEKLLSESRHRVSVVRFSGIYGRSPSHLLNRLAQGKRTAMTPPRYSNRIHRDDCIACLEFLLQLESRESLYLASDCGPGLQREVEDWLSQQLGYAEREEIRVSGANRRCSNKLLLQQGFRFRHPDYRSGYSAMISSTSIPTALGSAAT